MLIATMPLLVGLSGGLIATRAGNLRLGGVVIVPLVAIYALYNFNSLPVFVFGFVAA